MSCTPEYCPLKSGCKKYVKTGGDKGAFTLKGCEKYSPTEVSVVGNTDYTPPHWEPDRPLIWIEADRPSSSSKFTRKESINKMR